MDTETKVLRQDLEIAQENLKAVTNKCRSLVYELENCTANYDAEKTLRDRQLSRILRALLKLEAQLKQEQKTIQQLLQEKDNIIQAQKLEIAKLRRYMKKYCKVKRDCSHQCVHHSSETLSDTSRLNSKNTNAEPSYDPNKDDKLYLQCDHESFQSVSGIQKKYSFADSDISKTSLTSSEISDVSNTTSTNTDNSLSLLSTEGFCEGESTDASPDSTLKKIDRFAMKGSINIEDDKSEYECNSVLTNKKDSSKVSVSEFASLISQDIMRNKINDDNEIIINNEVNERKEEMENNLAEPIYENINIGDYVKKEGHTSHLRDKCNNNNNISKRLFKPHSDQVQEETNNHWYSDPDEDRANDDVFQNTIYQSNSNHNSVLECVNQILLRDMEEEENVRVTSRRYKYKGKVVCFQTAKLSDIESVGSEVERRNSEDMMDNSKSPINSEKSIELPLQKLDDEFDSQLKAEATRIILDESVEKADGILNDTEEAKALVIIEPKEENIEETIIDVESEVKFVSCFPRNETKKAEKLGLSVISPKRLTIPKNLDYEEIESLKSEIACEKTPVQQQKPQFRNNTLFLKKIPSPSFLIDESQKKYSKKSPTIACKSLYDDMSNVKKSTLNQITFCQPLVQQFKEDLRNQKTNINDDNSSENSGKSNGNMGHFEEFKIEESEGGTVAAREKHIDFPEVYDVQQNFEEFKLDECDLSDDLSRLEADGSEIQISATNYGSSFVSSPLMENKNNQFNSCYDNFLEASGMSNKCILTPSRLISNHKSMLKPKDIKYKRKIKANGTIYEGQDTAIIGVTSLYNTKHWTGPFV